uniref:E3 ubiquitin protein ligase MARCH8 n=1 Tax=Echinococcus granulosus TaxID=6210 RepID=A0A068WRN0_ECHGR|nr:E3 ubiquitin protein ligase MARCH8 [Echinococcus granulosus]
MSQRRDQEVMPGIFGDLANLENTARNDGGAGNSGSSPSNSSTTSTMPRDQSWHEGENLQEFRSVPIISSPDIPLCRICHDSDSRSCGQLIAPCLCDGSLKYVHRMCLQRWLDISQLKKCELCHYEFKMSKRAMLMRKRDLRDISVEELGMALAFEPTVLLLAALVIWWFVFTFCHSSTAIPPASLSWGIYVLATLMALLFLYFVAIFICLTVRSLGYKVKYGSVVQDPSRQ